VIERARPLAVKSADTMRRDAPYAVAADFSVGRGVVPHCLIGLGSLFRFASCSLAFADATYRASNKDSTRSSMSFASSSVTVLGVWFGIVSAVVTHPAGGLSPVVHVLDDDPSFEEVLELRP
jgi:hypothetical protein